MLARVRSPLCLPAALAVRLAIEAGAGNIEIKLSRKDNAAIVEGREILIDCLVKATASGRPRVAV